MTGGAVTGRSPRAGQRVVVVSPHLDDAVLSIGAHLAHLARRGTVVEVLTVFGGDPTSERDPGRSNRRAGFATTGEAARVRRAEDDLACARLGLRPVRLGFDDDEASARDAEAITEALRPALAGADAVLLPGGPLRHPDHQLVARLAAAAAPGGRTGRYREQPYATWDALRLRRAAPEGGAPSPGWRPAGRCPRCRARKIRAMGAYRSQLRVLRRWPRLRITAHETLVGGERIAWPRAGA